MKWAPAFRVIGFVVTYIGLFIEIATANPWGTPALQPWFTIGGALASFGIGAFIAGTLFDD